MATAPAAAQTTDLTRSAIVRGGPATAAIKDSTAMIGNRAIEATWRFDTAGVRPASMTDRLAGRPISVSTELFTLHLADGSTISASPLKMNDTPRAENLTPDPRLAEWIGGRQITAEFAGPAGCRITWRAILRDGANYLRQPP